MKLFKTFLEVIDGRGHTIFFHVLGFDVLNGRSTSLDDVLLMQLVWPEVILSGHSAVDQMGVTAGGISQVNQGIHDSVMMAAKKTFWNRGNESN